MNTTEEKLRNVFGDDQLSYMRNKAMIKGKWITRHCNSLYIVEYNKTNEQFSFKREIKSNRLHKFHDWSKRTKR